MHQQLPLSIFLFAATLVAVTGQSKCGYTSNVKNNARASASLPLPSPTCLTDRWYFAPTTTIDFAITSSNDTTVEYVATCVGAPWHTANASFPVGGNSFTISFSEADAPPPMSGFPDAGCQVIDWHGLSNPWCRNLSACQPPPPAIPPFWVDGLVHLVEVSHSDIGWLGTGGDSWGPGLPDLIDDTRNIATALDMMGKDSSFVWQHECILFLRCFVEMYPEREAELALRISQGRFDIGGTFSEPLESTLLNELLARQMYTGRKWFVERYPGLDSARVAFHQDGPLRALQMPQVYRKAGIKYMKSSRWSDNIQAWHGADDASYLLSMTELHYGQADCTVEDLALRLSNAYNQYLEAGLPPQAIQALGIDYSPPINYTEFLGAWEGQAQPHPPMVYSTFHAALKALDVGAAGLRHVKGERPNLWYIEGCPPHHNMCNSLREGARTLPGAETWSAFSSLALDTAAAAGGGGGGGGGGGSGGAGDPAPPWRNYPSATLDAAWLNLTLTDHGIAGEPTPRNFTQLPSWFINPNSPPTWDLAYADKWVRAAGAGAALAGEAQARVAAAVSSTGAPSGALSRLVVFNPLSWNRSAPALVPLLPPSGPSSPCALGPTACPSILDSQGQAVPSQCTTFADPSLPTGAATTSTTTSAPGPCTLVFLAPNLPSLGYATFYLLPPPKQLPQQQGQQQHPAASPNPGDPWTEPFSTPFFKVTPGVGGLASLVDLSSGLEVFNVSSSSSSFSSSGRGGGGGGGGYLAGEWMSLEYTGMGASETRSYEHAGKGSGFQRLSDFPGATWSCVESGPVRAVFATAPVDTAHSRVTLSLVLYMGTPRLDLGVTLEGWDSAFGVANRLAFPLRTTARNVSYAVPFGVVRVGVDEAEEGEDDVWLQAPGPSVPPFERGWAMHPREISDWMAGEGGVGEAGLLLSSSVGTFDWVDCSGLYPPTAVVLAPELLLHTNSNRGPYLPEPGNHSFHFSLVPMPPPGPGPGPAQGWKGAWRRGVEANNPPTLLVVPLGGSGQLPPTASLLSVAGDGEGSWVTAVKKQDDGQVEVREGLVVRLFNVDGVDRNVTLSLDLPGLTLKGADRVNLIELEPEATAVSGNSIPLTLGHWAIETLSLSVI